MVRRRVLIALGWAVVTAGAVAIASLAVSHAVANVADPLPAMISGSSRAEASSSTSTTAATVDASPSTTTTPGVVADGSIASAGASSSSADADPSPASGIADPVAVQSSDDDNSAAPPPPAANTRSFSKTGGVVTMSCDGQAATLVSATPAPGYTVNVSNSGPEQIEVAFTAGSRDSDFHGQCVNGQPTEEVSDD